MEHTENQDARKPSSGLEDAVNEVRVAVTPTDRFAGGVRCRFCHCGFDDEHGRSAEVRHVYEKVGGIVEAIGHDTCFEGVPTLEGLTETEDRVEHTQRQIKDADEHVAKFVSYAYGYKDFRRILIIGSAVLPFASIYHRPKISGVLPDNGTNLTGRFPLEDYFVGMDLAQIVVSAGAWLSGNLPLWLAVPLGVLTFGVGKALSISVTLTYEYGLVYEDHQALLATLSELEKRRDYLRSQLYPERMPQNGVINVPDYKREQV